MITSLQQAHFSSSLSCGARLVQAEFTAARRRASSPLQHTTQHLESSFECGAHEFALAHLQSQLAIALSCFTEPEAAAVVTMCTTIITTRMMMRYIPCSAH